MPLFSLVAMTEGQLGSLIAIALYRRCGRRHPIVAMLSHVIVDLDDPAFRHPTKPIGPFFSDVAATELGRARRWQMREDSGRGYRRVVASPEPKGFVEIDAIRSLLDAGHVVVTGGGGGIPVGRRGDIWDGVDAVIDKDYAAAELASQLRAEALVLVTGVDAVHLDFGKETQRRLALMDATEAERHLRAGQFPEGSMGPKVRAATRFVRQGGQLSVITSAGLVVATLDPVDRDADDVGTRIVPVGLR
jgi:carbamate kinase